MQTLGTYLRALRGKRRISLRRVAAKARISAEYLSDIELGRRHPSDRVLAELATALNTSVDDLRRHDPKALISDIQKRVDEDVGYADALRRLLRKFETPEELVRFFRTEALSL
jgi:transcriptional regulator with XRE-family HTH domain